MMKIYIDQGLLNMPQVRSIDRTIIDSREFFRSSANGYMDDEYTLTWGTPPYKKRYGVAETGFWWDAMHIDTIGLYHHSSLNTLNAFKIIGKYDPPADIRDLVKNARLPQSKYRQPKHDIEWTGVVFASQNPMDRSVHSCTSTDDWCTQLKKASEYYGKDLLVKLHPWNSGKIEELIRNIAEPSGCTVLKTGHKCLEKCDHVVLGCSSFAVDCMMRGVRVKQLLPGYFYQLPAVTYTAGDVTKSCKNTVEWGYKLANFLAWRYCFSMDCTLDTWRELLRRFANDRRLFPLPESMSYGQYLLDRIESCKKK